MTEAEWLDSTNSWPLVEFLRSTTRDRKIRLFSVACCRRVSHLIRDERSRKSIDLAEELASGTASERDRRQQLEVAAAASLRARREVQSPEDASRLAVSSAVEAAELVLSPAGDVLLLSISAKAAAHASAYEASARVGHHEQPVWGGPFENEDDESVAWVTRLEAFQRGEHFHVALDSEWCWQAHLLRCVFGNPFRPVSLDPTWRTPIVLALASGIYADRAFDCLPILADALQDAGCDHPEILAHCRGDGPHVRGCWVVDLVLGKA